MDTPLRVAAVIKPCGSGMCKIAPAQNLTRTYLGLQSRLAQMDTLASGSNDQTVRLWDVQERALATLHDHTGGVGRCFQPNGRLSQ